MKSEYKKEYTLKKTHLENENSFPMLTSKIPNE